MTGKLKVFAAMAISALVAVLLFLIPTTASAVTTNLNAGESVNLLTLIDSSLSVQIGDKVFGDFFWNDTYDSGAPDMAASNVNVKALLNLNDIGLRLEFLPVTAGPGEFKDFVFEYTVAVTNSPNLISDMHLSIDGTAGGSAFASVGETAHVGGLGGTIVGSLGTNLFAGDPTPIDVATNLDYAVTKLWIEKDVTLYGPDDSVAITSIDQTFSQIPEPSTALLVGLGLLGAVAANRKRKS